jgi:exopolyphosphatase / guanosine-5'-triphosphate,3'-diphosphate pyrophosphatase
VLPRAPLVCQKGKVVLMLPPDLVDLNSDRLQNRLKQFSKLIGGEPEIQAIAV